MQASHRALALLESTPNSSLTAMRVQVFLTLAGIHEDLVELETVQRALSQAYSALQAAGAGDVAAMVETLNRLGNVARLRGLRDEAEQRLQQALAIAALHPDLAGGLTAAAQNTLAITFKDGGRYDEAAALYRDVLAEAITTFGPTSSAVASAHHNLAGLAYARGDYQAAEPLARHAVQLRAQLMGAGHKDVAADLAVLAAARPAQAG